MIICTIDPGIRNFAIYVEEYDESVLKRESTHIKNRKKSKAKNGKKTKKMTQSRSLRHDNAAKGRPETGTKRL